MEISFTKFCELLISNQNLQLICTDFDFQLYIFFLRHKEERKPYHFTETVKMSCKISKEETKLAL